MTDAAPGKAAGAIADLRLHGAPYSHDGPCQGVECQRCYKYSCPRCGNRSNFMTSCYRCASSAGGGGKPDRASPND